MGYCTWRQYSGGAVAAWIGTGTDEGKQVTVTYRTGTIGARLKGAACDDVRKQFCQKFGKGGKCFTASPPKILNPVIACNLGDLFGKCEDPKTPVCGDSILGALASSSKCLCGDLKSGKCRPPGTSKLNLPEKPKTEDPYCKTVCDSLPIWANLGCRVHKARVGCTGMWATPALEGSPFGNLPTWVLYGAGLLILLVFLRR